MKTKALRAFESALTGKGQLLQVSPQMHFQYKSEEVSRRLVMRATEICDIFTATIEQAYGLPETGVRPDALGQAQMPVLLDEKVYGYEGSGPWSVTTALILLPQRLARATRGRRSYDVPPDADSSFGDACSLYRKRSRFRSSDLELRNLLKSKRYCSFHLL